MSTIPTTDRAHSTPPNVTIDGRGQWCDTPVITLELEGGAIDASITRGLARALHDNRGAYWLNIIARGDAADRDDYLTRALTAARGRGVFDIKLTLEAAYALREQLDAVLEIAESSCRRDGCDAVPVRDGLCVGHDEAAYVPTLRSVTA